MAKSAQTSASERQVAPDPSRNRQSSSLLSTEGLLRTSDFRVAAAIGTIFTVIATLLVFSRSNYYIELADQSLYLLMTDDPRAAIRSASGYHVLLSPLFSLVGESVVNFRRLRAVLDIGVDIGLGVSLVRYLRFRGSSELFESTPVALTVVSSVTLAGFGSWIYAVNGFGYDQLGAIIFTLLTTVILWIISSEDSPSGDAVLAALAGALFAMALVVRWTAALASLGLFIWVLVEHVGLRKTLTLLGAGCLGVLGAFSLIHVAILDITVVAGGILDGTVDVSRDSHSLGVLFGEYVEWLYKGISFGTGLLIASVAALFFVKLRARFDLALVAGLLTVGLVMFTVQTVFGLATFIQANTLGTYLALICGLSLLSRLRENVKVDGMAQAVSGLSLPVALTVVPVLLAAGSLLPLFLTALPLATLWVGGLWLMLPNVTSQHMRTSGMIVATVLLSAMPWLVWQSFQNPARTELAENPALVDRGRFEGLIVDEVTQQLLHDLEDLRVQLDPNPTVLSFWVRPVVPFALDGTGLGFPWYSVVNAPNAAAETISGACLDDGDIPEGDVVFVTEERDPIEFGPIRGALSDCGIDFPVDFELLETMTAPGHEGDVELFVYLREADG